MSKEMRDAARDAQMQHSYAEICESRKVDWDDWELAWFLGAKFVQAEKDALEGALRELLTADGHKMSCSFTGCSCNSIENYKAARTEAHRILAALKGDKK